MVQRKMLRLILNARRRTVPANSSNDSISGDVENDANEVDMLEPWPDFLRRTAQWTREQLGRAGLKQWIVQWRQKKWEWAAKLAMPGNDKWSAVATLWQPLIHSSCPRGRKQARPKKRWEEDIVDYLGKAYPEDGRPWHKVARDIEWWLSKTDEFSIEQQIHE